MLLTYGHQFLFQILIFCKLLGTSVKLFVRMCSSSKACSRMAANRAVEGAVIDKFVMPNIVPGIDKTHLKNNI